MGRAARTCDDRTQSAGRSGLGIFEHSIWHAVGRNHPGFKTDAKLLENLYCVLHGVPVRTGTHDDADLKWGHSVEFSAASRACR